MPTLTGIGLAIAVDVLLRISVILIVALLLAFAARRSAAMRHAVLVAGLAAAYLMPMAVLLVPMLPVSRRPFEWFGRVGTGGPTPIDLRSVNRPQQHPTVLDLPAPAFIHSGVREGEVIAKPGASSQRVESSLEGRREGWLDGSQGRMTALGLVSIWMFGALVRLAGLGISLVRLRRIVARAHPVAGDQLLSMLPWVQRRIQMREAPRLLESAEVDAPVATGVVGNAVLLPKGWAGRSGLDETLAILCHESAHLARRDHRVVILQETLASVLWFHPLLLLFNRVLNRAREEVCDNYAIAVVDRASYCETLLLLALGGQGDPLRGATSMWSPRWSLEDRVRGILDEHRPTSTEISTGARWLIAMGSLVICGLVAMPRSAATASSPPPSRVGRVASVSTRMIHKSFPIDGREWLRVENLAGRVELVPGKGPEVEVEAIVRVSELPVQDARRLIDDIRWVEAPAGGSGSRWGLALPEGRYAMVRYPVSGESPPGIATVDHLGRRVLLSDRP
ncbi:M56 family metallopeptidase, partial [Singulisphaera rosea]